MTKSRTILATFEWAYKYINKKEPRQMHRKEILEKAIAATCGDRNQQYGEPEHNLGVTADLLNVCLGFNTRAPKYQLAATDVALIMCVVKLGRILTAPGIASVDTFIDLAAYAAMAGELADAN